MTKKKHKGLSLVELILSMAMASILVVATYILLIGSNKSFNQVYASVHDSTQQDSRALTSVFGAITRKANRTNYVVYKNINGQYVESVPQQGESFAYGQAVELRYWDRPFYELVQGMNEIDTSDTGSHYAFFYLDGDKIYVDYGTVTNGIGAINGGIRQTNNIRTQLLVEKVDTNNTDIFSHEVVGGKGTGCVTLDLTVLNQGGDSIDVKMASLVRVVWPQ